jgi:hypothetical protein
MKKMFWKFVFLFTGVLLTLGVGLRRVRKAYKLSIRCLSGKALPVQQSCAHLQTAYDEFFGAAYPPEGVGPFCTKAEIDARRAIEKETGVWPVFLPCSN